MEFHGEIIVLDAPNAFYRVWYAGFLYKLYLDLQQSLSHKSMDVDDVP